jgi:hypothetical protein
MTFPKKKVFLKKPIVKRKTLAVLEADNQRLTNWANDLVKLVHNRPL